MFIDWPYRLALILIATCQLSISRRYMKRTGAGANQLQGRAEGILLTVALGVSYVAYGLAVLVYLLNPHWMDWSALPLHVAVRWMGAVLMALGAALHIWGMHHLGNNLTITIVTREGHTLTTTGPFAWVRHPLYVGGMVESLGVCLLVGNMAVAAFAALFWAFVAWRTPMEEARLIGTFGVAYQNYMARVGRFFPRFPREKP